MLVQMKIGKQANSNAFPIKRREGEQIEDRKNCLRQKFIKRPPMDFGALSPLGVISRHSAAIVMSAFTLESGHSRSKSNVR